MQERIKHWWSNTFLPALKAMPKNLQIFLSTPMVLKNLGLMLVALLSFGFIVILGLNIYTQHGESIYLDNLQRLPIKKVEKMARKGDFKVVVFDSIWKPDIKSGVVLEQNPIPGSKIKEGRTVYLTISSSTPPKVELPLFRDAAYMYQSYKRILDVRGINSVVKEEIIDTKQAKGTILYMYHDGKKIEENVLKEGYLIEKGDAVELVITKQIIAQRTVPELVCLKLSTAKFLLETSQLNFDAFEDPSVIDLEEAYIYKQNPDPGTNLISGDYVKVYLTLERPMACGNDELMEDNDPEPTEDNF
ncbi:MAG: PASTA domain-containing protein [Saprospiraceae bacterium]|nr:PASTA domain-containing protein [Saprospiraceae bacterium]